MRKLIVILWTLIISISTSCSSEEVAQIENPIVGQWFLSAINDTDVSNLDCYQESYIRSDGQTIDFYLVDLLEDGSCEMVLNRTDELTIEQDFYFIGEEAIEIYIEGSTLTWRIDFDTTLVFQKI
ncbi:MAG: hypothetical protein AAF554_05895 [Bacteroidota bacterium]